MTRWNDSLEWLVGMTRWNGGLTCLIAMTLAGLTGTIKAIVLNALASQPSQRLWAIGTVRTSIRLQRLALSQNGLRLKSAQLLSELLLSTSTLRALILADNSMGDEGAAHIAAALKVNTTLLEIDLGNNM